MEPSTLPILTRNRLRSIVEHRDPAMQADDMGALPSRGQLLPVDRRPACRRCPSGGAALQLATVHRAGPCAHCVGAGQSYRQEWLVQGSGR